MNKNIFLAIMLMLILGSGIIFWSVLPPKSSKAIYTLQFTPELFPDDLHCGLLGPLSDAEFKVDYPREIDQEDSGKMLILVLNKSFDRSEEMIANSDDCSISLEVWIDAKNILILPGERNIQLYSMAENQSFIFDVNPLSTIKNEGKIWVFVRVSEFKDETFDRVPLLVIPFEIRTRSFFGIAPKTIRSYSVVILLLAGAGLVWAVKNKNER